MNTSSNFEPTHLEHLVNPSIDPSELNCGIGSGDSDFYVYMRAENRPDLVEKAVNSIPELWPLLTFVDNSPGGLKLSADFPVTPHRFPIPLRFTDTHNWFFKNAKERGAKFLIWMHMDAEAVDNGHLRLLDFVRNHCVGKRKWGLVWTYYDTIAAVNLEMIEDVGGYDPVFEKYFADNDHTRRMRLRGWETIDTGIKTKHVGSQTIKSDPKLLFLNDVTFPIYQQYYRRKWAGEPENEKYDVPFGREDLFA